MTLIGNRPEWVETMVACFRIGAVVLPCTEQLRAKDLALRIDGRAARGDPGRRAQPRRARGGAAGLPGAARPRRAPLRRRPASVRRTGPRRPVPDHLHVGHRRRAQGSAARPALPRRPARAGRALARRAGGRPRLVHGGQRLEQVGAQRVHRAVDARRDRAPARRALRSRRAPGDRRARARRRALHGADRVPRDRQARDAARRCRRSAASSPPARRSTPRCCAPGRRRPACRSATATARPRPAS